MWRWVRWTHRTLRWVRWTHRTPHWVPWTHRTPHWVRWTHRTPHWVRWTHPTPHWGVWPCRTVTALAGLGEQGGVLDQRRPEGRVDSRAEDRVDFDHVARRQQQARGFAE